MSDHPPAVNSDPEILGGTPVFAGTRVPAKTLFDYLEGGETLDRLDSLFRRALCVEITEQQSSWPKAVSSRSGGVLRMVDGEEIDVKVEVGLGRLKASEPVGCRWPGPSDHRDQPGCLHDR